MSTRCIDCGQEHDGPRCLPPAQPHCTGSYTAEFSVTLEDVLARPAHEAKTWGEAIAMTLDRIRERERAELFDINASGGNT